MVTDEMVEKAANAIAEKRGYAWPGTFDAEEIKIGRENMRAALEAALSAAEPVSFEGQNYNCPCVHPSQCDESCLKPAPSVAAKAAWVAKAAVLRSRGKNNTLHDINQAADYLDAAALSAQVQDVAGLLDETWNAAVEQAAAIANDCVHLTPDPGAAIRTMVNGRTKLHPAAPAKQEG